MQMLKSFQARRAMISLACVAALIFPMFGASAAVVNDAQILAMKAALIKAMQEGTTAAVSQQQANDTAARSSQQCADIANQASLAAQAAIDRNRPPDPTSIIQNTTCHVDVSTVKIPVIMTGIPFIDDLVSGYIQKYLTGACQKGQAFLGDLKKTALTQLNTATGGAVNQINGLVGSPTGQAANAVFSYATDGKIDLVAVQKQGSATVQGLSGSVANSSGSIGAATDSLNKTVQTATTVAAQGQAATTSLLCSYGIPNDQACPVCVVNPMHASCLGPKPYCGQIPGVVEPYCQPQFSNDGGR